jgi:hypothetical protein
MASHQKSWLDTVSEYIAKYPAVSTAVAFEVGMLAGQAARNAEFLGEGAAKFVKSVPDTLNPSKLAQAMPSSLNPFSNADAKRKSRRSGAHGRGRKLGRRRHAKRKPAEKAAA